MISFRKKWNKKKTYSNSFVCADTTTTVEVTGGIVGIVYAQYNIHFCIVAIDFFLLFFLYTLILLLILYTLYDHYYILLLQILTIITDIDNIPTTLLLLLPLLYYNYNYTTTTTISTAAFYSRKVFRAPSVARKFQSRRFDWCI